MYKNYIKRIFDILLSFIIIIVFFLFFLTIFILMLFYGFKNIIFVQERIGFKNKKFSLYKLKTMKDLYDSDKNLLNDSQRITKMGKILRKLSIDELPQVINVIKGDMSIVGPRPLLPEYLPLYNDFQKRRHEVKPGITGWAQVNGRNAISWKKKFELDVWYVDNLSFLLDIKILFLTIIKVFKREGISSGTNVTMEKFNGSN